DITHGARNVLPGQAVHEIEVEVGEPGGVQLFSGARRLARRVDATQLLELGRVEALRTQRDPIHPDLAITGEPAALDRAGVGFERDLAIRGELEVLASRLEH